MKDHLAHALRLLRQPNRRASLSSLDSSTFAQIVGMCDLDDVSRRWLSMEYSRDGDTSRPTTALPEPASSTPSTSGMAPC